MREDEVITEAQEKTEAARPIEVHPPKETRGAYYVEEVKRSLSPATARRPCSREGCK